MPQRMRFQGMPQRTYFQLQPVFSQIWKMIPAGL